LKIPNSWRPWLDPLLHEEPGATRLAIAALLLMLVGAVLTVWRGRWYYRLMLLAGAAVWPLPDHHLFQRGEVVLIVIPGHGLHPADFLSLGAVIVALVPWVSIRRSLARRLRTSPAPAGRDRAGR
jgi:hypothetical protein